MTIRMKFLWRVISILLLVAGAMNLIEKISNGISLHFREWVVIVSSPFLIYLCFFIALTLRVNFSDWGINATWKVGIGPFKIWEQKNYRLRWEDLTAVYSVFPLWIPLHMIGVAGYQHDLDKARNFFIGFATTKKKESLLYIADHVSPEIISDEVQNLVEKYRTQKERKQNACAK